MPVQEEGGVWKWGRRQSSSVNVSGAVALLPDTPHGYLQT